ncbi:hypothetical protein HanRHA438_Chr05g0236641 [Helianthus annuus]|nr:hypothetical protein HanRHA438_Chr05g0236641 [Helianthus annuus]
MLEASSGSILQNGSVLVDIPLVDVKFYGNEIWNYKEDLKTAGVRFENKEACEFIGERLMSLAASSKLTRDNVASILKFIRYLGAHYIPSTELVNRIKQGKWVKTSLGDMTPDNSVLFSNEWKAASQLSNIPFIDQDYYGEVLSFKKELELLGVMVNFDKSRYQLVSDNLKSSSLLTSLSSEAMLLLLRCIEKLRSSDKLVQAVKNKKCVKTNLGYRCPSECFLVTSETKWGCLLQVFGSFPILDANFYGSSIFSMEKELKKIGVMIDFEDAAKEFTRIFKQQASASSIRKENVFSFLECYRKLKKIKLKFPEELTKCIREDKWLKTKLGDYKSPKECILFGAEWESITPITILPFIDDSSNFYGNGIHDYKAELKLLGVTTEFKDGAKFVAAGLYLPECSSFFEPFGSKSLNESLCLSHLIARETASVGIRALVFQMAHCGSKYSRNRRTADRGNGEDASDLLNREVEHNRQLAWLTLGLGSVERVGQLQPLIPGLGLVLPSTWKETEPEELVRDKLSGDEEHPANGDTIFDSPPVYDEYEDGEWYSWMTGCAIETLEVRQISDVKFRKIYEFHHHLEYPTFCSRSKQFESDEGTAFDSFLNRHHIHLRFFGRCDLGDYMVRLRSHVIRITQTLGSPLDLKIQNKNNIGVAMDTGGDAVVGAGVDGLGGGTNVVLEVPRVLPKIMGRLTGSLRNLGSHENLKFQNKEQIQVAKDKDINKIRDCMVVLHKEGDKVINVDEDDLNENYEPLHSGHTREFQDHGYTYMGQLYDKVTNKFNSNGDGNLLSHLNISTTGGTSLGSGKMTREVKQFRQVVVIITSVSRVDVPFDPGGFRSKTKLEDEFFSKRGSMMQEHAYLLFI